MHIEVLIFGIGCHGSETKARLRSVPTNWYLQASWRYQSLPQARSISSGTRAFACEIPILNQNVG